MNNLISAILPWIGTAVGGPLGGMALSFIGDKLGLSDKTKEGLETFIKGATPEDLMKAKSADQEFQLKMAELGFHQTYDIEKLNVDDRMNARDREVKTGDNTTRILALSYTLGYFTILAFVFFSKIPPENANVLNTLLGVLSTVQVGIINYYFGSSKGSADKTEMLNNAVVTRTTVSTS